MVKERNFKKRHHPLAYFRKNTRDLTGSRRYDTLLLVYLWFRNQFSTSVPHVCTLACIRDKIYVVVDLLVYFTSFFSPESLEDSKLPEVPFRGAVPYTPYAPSLPPFLLNCNSYFASRRIIALLYVNNKRTHLTPVVRCYTSASERERDGAPLKNSSFRATSCLERNRIGRDVLPRREIPRFFILEKENLPFCSLERANHTHMHNT